MKKSSLISKYEHQLTLKYYSANTLKAYLNGLNIFLQYLSLNQIQEVFCKELDLFFHHYKKELGYSYFMMKQLLVSVKFLYEEVLNESVDYDFNFKSRTEFQWYFRFKK